MIAGASLGFALATFAGFGFAMAGLASLPVTMTTLFVGNIFLGVILPTAQVQALEEHGDIAGLASSLGGTLQMVAAGVLVVMAGPFLDGTVAPMLGAIAACGLIALVLSRLIPRHAALA
jgi:DHA1 family bicyclomycin/chloramphenicol resistance-like MFS transporter